MIHVKPNGEKVEYHTPASTNAGKQKVRLKRDYGSSRYGAIGTWQNYGGEIHNGAGKDRDPNTGRQVAFQRVEGKIKGVVKRDGCVVYA